MAQLSETIGFDAAAGRAGGWPRFRRLGLLTLFSVAIALLLSIPVLTVAWNVFQPSSDAMAHLASTVLPNYLLNTLVLVAIVGAGVMVIGVGTAWLVTMYRFPGHRLLQWALILPLAMPAYVIAYAYTDFLQFSGPVQSLLRDLFGWQTPRDYWFPQIRSVEGAAVMLTLVLYPYVYLLSRAAFLQQSVCALEVSRTLGCNGWRTFLRVGVPLARPAIVAGTVLALMETLADYGTVQYFGVQTFTTGIGRNQHAHILGEHLLCPRARFQNGVNTRYGSPCAVSTSQGSNSSEPLKLSARRPARRSARLMTVSRASTTGS